MIMTHVPFGGPLKKKEKKEDKLKIHSVANGSLG